MDSNFRFRARRNQEIYGGSSDDTSSHRSKALIDRPMATERAPRVSEAARITVEELSAGIEWVELRFGFAEKPNVPTALRAHAVEIRCDPTAAFFFVGREVPVASLQPEVPLWQERICALMLPIEHESFGQGLGLDMQVPALADRVVIAAGRAHAAAGGDRRPAHRDAFRAGAVVTRDDRR
jgi:hypothetical protein